MSGNVKLHIGDSWGKLKTLVQFQHSRVVTFLCLTALFTKPPAGGRNELRDRSPIHGFRDFQELYQAKPGTALPAAL